MQLKCVSFSSERLTLFVIIDVALFKFFAATAVAGVVAAEVRAMIGRIGRIRLIGPIR